MVCVNITGLVSSFTLIDQYLIKLYYTIYIILPLYPAKLIAIAINSSESCMSPRKKCTSDESMFMYDSCHTDQGPVSGIGATFAYYSVFIIICCLI